MSALLLVGTRQIIAPAAAEYMQNAMHVWEVHIKSSHINAMQCSIMQCNATQQGRQSPAGHLLPMWGALQTCAVKPNSAATLLCLPHCHLSVTCLISETPEALGLLTSIWLEFWLPPAGRPLGSCAVLAVAAAVAAAVAGGCS